jgi:hypothetical protein
MELAQGGEVVGVVEGVEGVEVESILSPELTAELGGNALFSKKKKKKGSEGPTELVKMLAKQLSKKAQKRMDQVWHTSAYPIVS